MFNRILLTVVFSVFIALLGIGIIIPVLPLFAASLGATGFTLGLITAAFSLSRGLAQPLVGNLSDRWGRKGFMVAGLFIYGLVGLLIPHSASIVELILIRLLQGLGAAMVVPVAMAYAGNLAPVGQEGRYMGVVNIAIFCGIGCGPVLGGLASDRWGLGSVFSIMAVLCFCAFVLVLVVMPPYRPREQVKPQRLLVHVGRMLRRQRTMGILIARFATMLMMVPTMAFLPLIMTAWHATSGLQIGIVIACRTLVNAALQVPFGRLADRGGKVWLLLGGCVCMSLVLWRIPTAAGFSSMVIHYLFLGLGEAVIWPVLGAYAVEEGRNHFGQGTMMGMFNLAMSAGVFTGALLAGMSMDSLGLRQSFYITAGVLLSLTLIAVALIRAGEARGEGPAVPPEGPSAT